jgi:hypothetical protein
MAKRGGLGRLGASFVAIAIAAASPARASGDDLSTRSGPVIREGATMGLDPGLALRFDASGMPLYARLDLRIAGCLTRWLQLGGDVRADILSTITRGAAQRRYEIGPVAAFFVARGWFTRLFVHFAGVDPVSFTAGGQTGYEFSWDRFTALGVALGGDADVPVDGRPLLAYSFSISVYLSAYALGTRSGRDPGGY